MNKKEILREIDKDSGQSHERGEDREINIQKYTVQRQRQRLEKEKYNDRGRGKSQNLDILVKYFGQDEHQIGHNIQILHFYRVKSIKRRKILLSYMIFITKYMNVIYKSI